MQVTSLEDHGAGDTLAGMRDFDVRSVLKSQLVQEHWHEAAETLVVDELGLCNEVRVDVAAVNGALSGSRSKSARDKLTRLPGQVATYSKVLDHATLVVAESHLKSARREIRPWWGLRVARSADGITIVEEARAPKQNQRFDKYALLQLLWKQEALELLAQRGLDIGVRSKPRDMAWARLSKSFDLDELRDCVRAALKARRGWRDVPARAEGDETSRREGTLSRFLARRLRSSDIAHVLVTTAERCAAKVGCCRDVPGQLLVLRTGVRTLGTPDEPATQRCLCT